ncbi:MAG: four helix bundle protein [Candidatus Methylomirabilales bacterium]
MKIERFEDIQAWQEARKLAGMLVQVTRSRSLSQDGALKEQIDRASISIMANIAEGFESQSDGEFARFLVYARRSAAELQSHLYLALDRGQLPSRDFQKLYAKLEEIRALIGGFLRYLSRPAEAGGRRFRAADGHVRRRTDTGRWGQGTGD